MNSPSEGSRESSTPLPLKHMTSSVAAPYMQYPAATMSLPVRRMSSVVPMPGVVFSYTAKIVPVLTLQSMFDEPSSGSKATQKRPAFSSGTMIGSSFSSLTSTAHAPELTNAEMKMSLDGTSSFFWSSPLEFWSPAMPNRLAIPALAHARDVALHARPSCAIRMVSSMSLVLFISQRPRVMKSASFMSSTLVVAAAILLAWWSSDSDDLFVMPGRLRRL